MHRRRILYPQWHSLPRVSSILARHPDQQYAPLLARLRPRQRCGLDGRSEMATTDVNKITARLNSELPAGCPAAEASVSAVATVWVSSDRVDPRNARRDSVRNPAP